MAVGNYEQRQSNDHMQVEIRGALFLAGLVDLLITPLQARARRIT